MSDIQFQLMLAGEIIGYEAHAALDDDDGSCIHIMQAYPVDDCLDLKWLFIDEEFGDDTEIEQMSCDAKKQYTRYDDYDGNPIYDGNIVEIENGSFVGCDPGESTLHYIMWCPGYGSWVMIGLDVFCEDGEPSKNSLNDRWVDRKYITATSHPLRVVGYIN